MLLGVFASYIGYRFRKITKEFPFQELQCSLIRIKGLQIYTKRTNLEYIPLMITLKGNTHIIQCQVSILVHFAESYELLLGIEGPYLISTSPVALLCFNSFVKIAPLTIQRRPFFGIQRDEQFAKY